MLAEVVIIRRLSDVLIWLKDLEFKIKRVKNYADSVFKMAEISRSFRKSINLWTDPWLQGHGLQHHFQGPPLLCWGPPREVTLSTLFRDGKWHKPHRWPAEHASKWDVIKEIEIGGDGNDIMIWTGSKKPLKLYGQKNFGGQSNHQEGVYSVGKLHSIGSPHSKDFSADN
ncbi:hypothetical protein QJS10_CPA02g00873 [Acorus calamus]|uniref:Uncharacterized protein n=1 Tax=Acorus calamus TaxID=4465 RepID=A0AAV9FCQ7_ACOCL|nr:hypothetical protein QJS10_CPA02g00873 [Acorus calamus]